METMLWWNILIEIQQMPKNANTVVETMKYYYSCLNSYNIITGIVERKNDFFPFAWGISFESLQLMYSIQMPEK